MGAQLIRAYRATAPVQWGDCSCFICKKKIKSKKLIENNTEKVELRPLQSTWTKADTWPLGMRTEGGGSSVATRENQGRWSSGREHVCPSFSPWPLERHGGTQGPAGEDWTQKLDFQSGVGMSGADSRPDWLQWHPITGLTEAHVFTMVSAYFVSILEGNDNPMKVNVWFSFWASEFRKIE